MEDQRGVGEDWRKAGPVMGILIVCLLITFVIN
jgi:hypothetical protein